MDGEELSERTRIPSCPRHTPRIELAFSQERMNSGMIGTENGTSNVEHRSLGAGMRRKSDTDQGTMDHAAVLPRSPFPVLSSEFYVLRSEFYVLRSPFPVLRLVWTPQGHPTHRRDRCPR